MEGFDELISKIPMDKEAEDYNKSLADVKNEFCIHLKMDYWEFYEGKKKNPANPWDPMAIKGIEGVRTTIEYCLSEIYSKAPNAEIKDWLFSLYHSMTPIRDIAVRAYYLKDVLGKKASSHAAELATGIWEETTACVMDLLDDYKDMTMNDGK